MDSKLVILFFLLDGPEESHPAIIVPTESSEHRHINQNYNDISTKKYGVLNIPDAACSFKAVASKRAADRVGS